MGSEHGTRRNQLAGAGNDRIKPNDQPDFICASNGKVPLQTAVSRYIPISTLSDSPSASCSLWHGSLHRVNQHRRLLAARLINILGQRAGEEVEDEE